MKTLFDQPEPEVELLPEPQRASSEKFAYVVPPGRVLFERSLTETEADEKNFRLEKLGCLGRYCKRENLNLNARA